MLARSVTFQRVQGKRPVTMKLAEFVHGPQHRHP